MGEFQDYLTLVGECLDTGNLWEVENLKPLFAFIQSDNRLFALVQSTLFRILLFLRTPVFLVTRKLSPATLAK